MAAYTNYAIANNVGVLNGTSQVTLVAAPAANQVISVRNIVINNIDTVAQTITIYKKVSSTLYQIFSDTLQPGDQLVLDEGDISVLDVTTKSIVAVMGSVATTNNPTFDANYSVQS